MRITDQAADLDCILTLQAVSEFFVVACRKVPKAVAAAAARDWLELFPYAAPTAKAVDWAIEHSVSGRASYWDALLIASAGEAGCTAILTEDLTEGTTLGGVKIIDPFDDQGALSPKARALLDLG